MKLTVDRSTLAEAASWVSGAVSKNPASPPMAGMRIQVQQGIAALTGFDYDTMRQALVAVETDDDAPTDVLVSARFLVQIVAALKGETITLEHVDGRLVIAAGRSKYTARTMNPADYPELPTFPTHVGTIDAGALVDVLGTVEHAVSKDPNLKAMSAFNIVGDAGQLTVTTTDRYRLARASAGWADASGASFEVNVPGVALTNALRALDGEVQIGASDGLFGLSDKGRSIITRVLGSEDRFPRTAPIFAVTPLLHIDVSVAPLAEALKRSLLVADDTGMVLVEFSNQMIRVLGDGATSEGVEEVDTDPGYGEEDPMTLKFNATYLSQALLASPSPRVRFGLVAPGKQVLITPDGIDTAAFIVMPRAV